MRYFDKIFRGGISPALLAAVPVFLLVVIAAAAPLVTWHDPTAMAISKRFAQSSWNYPLGQDEFGRDIWGRLVYGARISLTVALTSAAIAFIVGTAMGLVGGYFRGLAELFTVRIADLILSFPPILLALLVVTIFGPGEGTLIGVLSVLYTPGFSRVAYGEVLSVRKLEFVEASKALGSSSATIVLRTILPNISGPLLVQFSLTVAAGVVIEAGLSFLGLGVIPPTPSWGLMIRSARGFMTENPLGLVWPCLALILTILLINQLCDALRDVFDPKGRTNRSMLQSLVGTAFSKSRARAAIAPSNQLLAVRDMSISIFNRESSAKASEDISFTLARGETVAIVGESGSGKSLTSLATMALLPKVASVTGGEAIFARKDGSFVDLLRLSADQMRNVRGGEIAMIFQEPMTALNPVYTIGDQIVEMIRCHKPISKSEAWTEAVELLRKVGITAPERRAREYAHQMSGGMRQRAMIAMALSCNPSLLIADEPTTALDVTIQADILDLLRRLCAEQTGEQRMGMIFISHNLGVVTEISDRVIVMYSGRIVEEGPTKQVFANPQHPYTRGLMASLPHADNVIKIGDGNKRRLDAISGSPPSLHSRPGGCTFAPRCPSVLPQCSIEPPLGKLAIDTAHKVRCHLVEEAAL
jgi:peptide/nickel transport system permease protein